MTDNCNGRPDVNHIKLNPDFVQEAKDRILSQFKNSTNINSLVEIDSERWKVVQDVLVDLAEKRLLDNATGVVLDNIGASIGLYRTSADDDQYRDAIKLRAYSRNINYDEDSIVDIISRYTGVSAEDIIVYKWGYKGVEFQIVTPFLTEEALREILRLFPAVADPSFVQKDQLDTLACIALDEFGNEVLSTDPNIKGLGSSDDSDPTDNVGLLSAMVYSKKLPS